MRHVLVLPHLSPDTVALALSHAVPAETDLDALLLPLEEANATAVLLVTPQGQPADVVMEEVARRLSEGDSELGLCLGTKDDPERSWSAWRGGVVQRRLGVADETWLPVDEDGFPDLEAKPLRFDEGPPAGWGRFRSCHDLGMQASFSCRFAPVEHLLTRLGRGEEVGTLAYALTRGGRPLHPPARSR